MNAAVDGLHAMASSMASANLPGEIVMVDRLCEKWARWVGFEYAGIGWSNVSPAARLMERHRLGLEREKLYPAGGKDKPPEGVMMIDEAVARLPEPLRLCIAVEYFTGGSRESKAKLLGISSIEFRQTLRGALWALYVRLDAQLEMVK